jgi:long-chain acyl-CoA synthetase
VDFGHVPAREQPGSVGIPVPGTEIRILDNAGRALPAGEPGEISCRSPGVMSGYWHSPEATAQALRDGWLRACSATAAVPVTPKESFDGTGAAG